MAGPLYIGVDSGTQGVKVVVLDGSSGRVIAEATAPHALVELDNGRREQEPAWWIEALTSALLKALVAPGVDRKLVKAIGVSGQQHGFVPLDAAGRVIRPAKLWCDTETSAEAEELTAALGGPDKTVELIGNSVAVGFTASKVTWLKKREPANYDRLDCILLPHDYLNFWLTGQKKAEYGDASGTAFFRRSVPDLVPRGPLGHGPVGQIARLPARTDRKRPTGRDGPTGDSREIRPAGRRCGLLRRRGQHDGRHRLRGGRSGRGHDQPGHLGDHLRRGRQAGRRSGRGAGRLLLQLRAVAAPGLHHERDRRHRADPDRAGLRPGRVQPPGRFGPGRGRGVIAGPLFQRRTDSGPAPGHGRPDRPDRGQLQPGQCLSGGHGRPLPGVAVWAGGDDPAGGDPDRDPPGRRRGQERVVASGNRLRLQPAGRPPGHGRGRGPGCGRPGHVLP